MYDIYYDCGAESDLHESFTGSFGDLLARIEDLFLFGCNKIEYVYKGDDRV